MTSRRCAYAVAAALCLAVLPSSPALGADGDPSWTTIYASGPFAGAGWTRCPEPIRVSVDTRQLKASEMSKAKAAVKTALATWNAARVVRFTFGGQVPVRFDPSTGVSTPEDGQTRDRWIYLTLVKGQKQGKGSDSQVVGLAGPLTIDPTTKAITQGSAAFQAQYVNREKKSRIALLFAHELGHVFGLGHSSAKADIMYPVLHDQTRLGRGDKDGIWAVLKPCASDPTATAADPTQPGAG